MSNRPNDDNALTLLAETENYAVLIGEDADGERIYNIELGNVTLHLFEEEWREISQLIRDASKK